MASKSTEELAGDIVKVAIGLAAMSSPKSAVEADATMKMLTGLVKSMINSHIDELVEDGIKKTSEAMSKANGN